MSWQSILVQWDPPASSNGVITHYIITVEGSSTNFSSYDTLHIFRNLLSNISYHFKIKAATSAGDGEEQICNASTLPERGNKLLKLILLFNLNDNQEASRPKIPASLQAGKSSFFFFFFFSKLYSNSGREETGLPLSPFLEYESRPFCLIGDL